MDKYLWAVNSMIQYWNSQMRKLGVPKLLLLVKKRRRCMEPLVVRLAGTNKWKIVETKETIMTEMSTEETQLHGCYLCVKI